MNHGMSGDVPHYSLYLYVFTWLEGSIRSQYFVSYNYHQQYLEIRSDSLICDSESINQH